MGRPAHEFLPERSRFRCTDIHAQHLASDFGVHAHRHAHDTVFLTRLDVDGIDSQVRPVALDGQVQKRLHACVDLLAQPRDLALGDAHAAHGLH